MKTVITVIVTLAVAGGAMWAFGHYARGPAAAQVQPTAVRMEELHPSDLVEVVSAPGTVEPRTKVSISARVAARIVELPFKEGEKVTKGNPKANPPIPPSVLVKLDDRDLQAALRSSMARYAAQEAEILVAEARLASQEASILAAKVTLADAERDLKRQLGLLESHDVSQSVVDTAQAKVDEQKAQVLALTNSLKADKTNLTVLKHNLEAAEADIAKAKEDVSNTVITSPIDGTVTKVNSEVGEMVVIGITNTPGTTIMEVADMNEMLFKAKVDEASIAQVAKGQKAKVHIPAYPDRTFSGVVDNVALANTEEKDLTKYFKADVVLDTAGVKIPSGLTADADIETQRHDGVLTVPSQAVLGRPIDDLPESVRSAPEVDKTKTLATVVYRVVNDKTVVTPVSVGASNATHTVIKSGLKPGDKVVTGPFKVLDTLANDTPVKDNKATTKPTTAPAAAATQVAEPKGAGQGVVGTVR